MFPSIFTPGTAHMGPLTGKASGLLVMAIVGGAIIPVIQGAIADKIGIHHCFILPLLCYMFIVFYGFIGSRPTGTSADLVATSRVQTQQKAGNRRPFSWLSVSTCLCRVWLIQRQCRDLLFGEQQLFPIGAIEHMHCHAGGQGAVHQLALKGRAAEQSADALKDRQPLPGARADRLAGPVRLATISISATPRSDWLESSTGHISSE